MANRKALGDYVRFSGMAAADLLYHEAPMVLLENIISATPDSACCQCLCGEDNPFFLPGVGVPPWVAIEFMAQCVAVSAGARALIAGKRLPLGLLLGTMSLKLDDGYFQPGQECRVESFTILSDDLGMGAHQCRVFVNGRVAAEARLTAKEIDRGIETVDITTR
jgi:predicted hotdog family 3-hydroxylacyl-ACP dehydratase